MQSASTYPEIVRQAIAATPVSRLLAAHSAGAIALERIARGGGATRWFVVEDLEQLGRLALTLSPGSSVSFYFDDRIARRAYDADAEQEVLRIAAEDGDAVVGVLTADGMELAVEFIASQSELDEVVSTLPPNASIFYGRFPARDNDGERAITFDLPDRDGVFARIRIERPLGYLSNVVAATLGVSDPALARAP